MLMRKYGEEIKQEQKSIREARNQANKTKHRKRMRY